MKKFRLRLNDFSYITPLVLLRPETNRHFSDTEEPVILKQNSCRSEELTGVRHSSWGLFFLQEDAEVGGALYILVLTNNSVGRLLKNHQKNTKSYVQMIIMGLLLYLLCYFVLPCDPCVGCNDISSVGTV